jgi:hypothetical protein
MQLANNELTGGYINYLRTRETKTQYISNYMQILQPSN